MRGDVSVFLCLVCFAVLALPSRRLQADQILPAGDGIAGAADASVRADAAVYADASDASPERVGALVSDEEAWELPLGIAAMVVGLVGLYAMLSSL